MIELITHSIMLVIKLILALIVIIIICFIVWWIFFKDSDSFVDFDCAERSVRPWWWYTHMDDNLYYTPDYTFMQVFYDGRPHNRWHYKYRPYDNARYKFPTGNNHHRSLNGSRHGSRHGPNHGRLRS